MTPLDDAVLDAPEAMAALDPGGLLRALATAGAQVREAGLRVEDDLLAPLRADGRPRAVVMAGVGASGVVAEVAAAVAGRSCPVPIVAHHGHRLPGWVGPMDLVVAVCGPGDARETLSALDEAMRRGARVVTIGAAGSALAGHSEQGAALHLPVDAAGRPPRANLWGLAVPALLVLDAVGVLQVRREELESLADDLDLRSERCGPATDVAVNPAKQVALRLAGSLPYLWGTSELAAAAAGRFAAQLAETAKHPAVHGALTEVHHGQAVVMAGRFGGAGAEDDIFRDPVEDDLPGGPPRMRVLLLRDTEEVPEVAERVAVTHRVAERYGVAVEEVPAEGVHPVGRLASLVAPLDFASAYLALLQGIDPSPTEPAAVLTSTPQEESR
jgi:glucose/mannose-6-phosphate isomerase